MPHVNCGRLIYYTPLCATIQKYIFLKSRQSLLSKNIYFYGVMLSDFLVQSGKQWAIVRYATESTLLALRGSTPNLRYWPQRLNTHLNMIVWFQLCIYYRHLRILIARLFWHSITIAMARFMKVKKLCKLFTLLKLLDLSCLSLDT